MSSNKKTLAYVLLFTATLTWGASFFLVKQGNQEIGLWPFITVRFMLGALFLGIPLMFRLLKSPKRIIKDGSVLGLLLFLAIWTQSIGLQTNSSGRSGFLTALYVPFTPLMAYLLLRQRVHLRQIIVVIVALIGLVVMTSKEVGESYGLGGWRPGDFWTLATAMISAAHIVMTERFTRRNVDSLILGVWQIIWASFFAVIACLIDQKVGLVSNPRDNWNLLTWSSSVWFTVLFITLLVTCFAFTVQIYAQKKVGSLKAAVIFALEAPFASLFAFIFVGELLTVREWIGAALVFISCIIPEDKKHGTL